MSPIAAVAFSAVLCALVLGAESASVSGKSDAEPIGYPEVKEMVKAKVGEYLKKAKTSAQKKCIVRVVAKPVLAAKLVELEVAKGKSQDELGHIQEEALNFVDDMSPRQKAQVKSVAKAWVQQKEAAMQDCLTL
ncbi:hypothetical protein AAG570_010065 [Ranatra chinensis]|uniref:Uncharacterized protein n=1 Tax=Ranatra chinensis TaxID=642074 RepID=A0ABD0YLL1_9HEMI